MGFAVVTGGNAPELLKPSESPLNAIALPVKLVVIFALDFSGGCGRNHRNGLHFLNSFENRPAVIRLVGQDGFACHAVQQGQGLGAIIDLSAGENKAQRAPGAIR